MTGMIGVFIDDPMDWCSWDLFEAVFDLRDMDDVVWALNCISLDGEVPVKAVKLFREYDG